MRRIVKSIPNTITSMNLLSGSIGVILCLSGEIKIAFVLMLASAVFDFFDGLAARLLSAYSDIGKELDSLADIVSFGLLPAIMLHQTMIENGITSFLSYIPLLLTVFSALRLAKFNIDDRQHDSFIGLPTPASAIICGSLAYYIANNGSSWIAEFCSIPCVLPILSIVIAFLLVSELPMFSMKFGGKTEQESYTKKIRITFFVIVVILIVIVLILKENWSLIPLLSFLTYILLNLSSRLIRKN